MAVTVPSKTEESLGIEKSDSLPEGYVPNPKHFTTAAQFEALKTAVIEQAEAINAGGGGGPPDLTPIVVADYTTPAITIEDVAAGGVLLSIGSTGLSGPTPIIVQPSVPADPNATGHGLALAGGVGGANDQNGGTVEIDAGPGNGAGVAGNVKVGRNESTEVLIGKEGGGGLITLEGDITAIGEADFSGSLTVGGPLSAGTRFSMGAVLTPSAIGANQIDYSPAGHGDESLLRLSSSAAYTIRSLGGAVNGWLLMLVNVGSFPITLAHEDLTGGVTPIYRFSCPGGVSLVLAPGDTVVLEYDSASARWLTFGGIGVITDAQHGARGGGTAHAAATRAAAGFMSALDKDSTYEALNRLVLRSEFLTLAEAFNLSNAGTGAGTTLVQGSGTIAGHPGLLLSTTGTTAAGRTGFWALTSASGSSWKFSGGMKHGFLFKLDQLSTGSEEFTLRVGMGDSVSAEPSEGLYFVYDRTVSTNWQLKSARLSSRSTASGGSSVAVAVGWVWLEWVANAAGTSVEGFVNGTSIGTVTTNLPNSVNNIFMGMHQLLKSVGSAPVTVVWDACAYSHDFPTARNV